MPERRKYIVAGALAALVLGVLVVEVGGRVLCSMAEGLPICSDAVEIKIPGLAADRALDNARALAADGQLEEAMALLMQARDLYVERANQLGEANAQAGIGQVALRLNDTELALEATTRARTRYGVLGDRAGEARTLTGRGDVQRERGQYGRAGEG